MFRRHVSIAVAMQDQQRGLKLVTVVIGEILSYRSGSCCSVAPIWNALYASVNRPLPVTCSHKIDAGLKQIGTLGHGKQRLVAPKAKTDDA